MHDLLLLCPLFPNKCFFSFLSFFIICCYLGGDPTLFSYAQTSSFTVKFLGHVPNVTPQSNVGSPESQISTLEAIDISQVCIITVTLFCKQFLTFIICFLDPEARPSAMGDGYR